MKRLLSALIITLTLWAQPASATNWTQKATAAAAGTNSAAATGLNCTGANLVVGLVAQYGAALVGADISDDTGGGNSYQITSEFHYTGDANVKGQWFYVLNPTVSGSETVTVTKAVRFIGVRVWCFAGAGTISFGAQVAANSALWTSLQPGSIGAIGDLVLTGVNYDGATGDSATVDSPFTTNLAGQNYGAGVNEGLRGSWFEVSGAVNPTWSNGTGVNGAAGNVNFTSTGGGGGGSSQPPCTLRLLGVGCDAP